MINCFFLCLLNVLTEFIYVTTAFNLAYPITPWNSSCLACHQIQHMTSFPPESQRTLQIWMDIQRQLLKLSLIQAVTTYLTYHQEQLSTVGFLERGR